MVKLTLTRYIFHEIKKYLLNVPGALLRAKEPIKYIAYQLLISVKEKKKYCREGKYNILGVLHGKVVENFDREAENHL